MINNILQAMDTFGDGEESGNFDPESFFDFNTKVSQPDSSKDLYSNPFTKPAETKTLTEEPKKEATQEKSPVTETPKAGPEKPVQDAIDKSSGFSLEDDDFNLEIEGTDETDLFKFDTEESISSDFNIEDEVLTERSITSRSRLDAIVEGESEDLSLEINIEETLTVDLEVEDEALSVLSNTIDPIIVEDDFSELKKIATQMDSDAVADSFSSNVEKSIVIEETEPSAFKFDDEENETPVVDDEDDSVDNDDVPMGTFKYEEEDSDDALYANADMDTSSDEDAPPEYKYEPSPDETHTNHKQEEQAPVQTQSQPKQQQPESNEGGTAYPFRTFDTPFGPKYRIHAQAVVKPEMINLDNFADKKDVVGDGYVTGARIIPYGDNNRRVEYQLLIANGVRMTAVQFGIPTSLTDDFLKQLVGNVLKFTGKWNLYRNTRNVTINKVENTIDTVGSDYITENDFEVYDEMFDKLYKSIKAPWIRNLLEEIFIADGYMEKTKASSAALSNHDTGIGDLYRHSVKIATLAYNNSMMYPNVNTDVVIVGSLLHDIGKVFEIGDSTYTTVGITTGHIVIAHNYVREKVLTLQSRGVPVEENVVLNILHCILSHHGELEYGSPVTPKTREAMIIHFADMVDSRVTNVDETLKGNGNRAFSKMLRHDVLDLNL